MCSIYGDPHIWDFNKERYDFMHVGPYNVMSDGDLKVQAYMCPAWPGRRWPGNSGAAMIALSAHGYTIVLEADGDAAITDPNGLVTEIPAANEISTTDFGIMTLTRTNLNLTKDEPIRRDMNGLAARASPFFLNFIWKISIPDQGFNFFALYLNHRRMRSGGFYTTWVQMPEDVMSTGTGLCMGKCKKEFTSASACENSACLPLASASSLFSETYTNEFDALCSNPQNGYTYTRVPEVYTWDNAQAQCKTMGGRLAIPRDNAEHVAIFTQIGVQGSGTSDFWLGGSNTLDMEPELEWYDGTMASLINSADAYDASKEEEVRENGAALGGETKLRAVEARAEGITGYAAWAEGYPLLDGANTSCVTIESGASTTATVAKGKWATADCSEKKSSVCEIPVPTTSCDVPLNNTEECMNITLSNLSAYVNLYEAAQANCSKIYQSEASATHHNLSDWVADCIFDFCALGGDPNVVYDFEEYIEEDELFHAPPPSPPVVRVGGDPNFFIGDKHHLVWLQPKQPNALLSIGSAQGRLLLNGQTLEAPGLEGHGPSEWLRSISLLGGQDEKTSIARIEIVNKHGKASASPNELRTLKVWLDGNRLGVARKAAFPSQRVPSLKVLIRKLPHKSVGGEQAEQAIIMLPRFNVSVSSASAAKFDAAKLQVKYAHLNLALSKVPKTATGMIAELAGVRPLSPATKAVLVAPREVVAARKAAHMRHETINEATVAKATKLASTKQEVEAPGSKHRAKASPTAVKATKLASKNSKAPEIETPDSKHRAKPSRSAGAAQTRRALVAARKPTMATARASLDQGLKRLKKLSKPQKGAGRGAALQPQ